MSKGPVVLGHEARIRRQIAQRLSLRAPQENSLNLLGQVLAHMDFTAPCDAAALLATIKAQHPTVTDFEREFPSLCFALATGVGKTRLMGAFIAYMYLSGRSKNFFVLAPNTTIYDKLIADFSRQSSPKYVFRGIAQFAQTPPIIVTGDTWQEGRGIRGSDLFGAEAIINIFNVDKINKDKGKIRSFRETLAEVARESLQPRFSELRAMGLVEPTGARRRNPSGKYAAVLRLTDQGRAVL